MAQSEPLTLTIHLTPRAHHDLRTISTLLGAYNYDLLIATALSIYLAHVRQYVLYVPPAPDPKES